MTYMLMSLPMDFVELCIQHLYHNTPVHVYNSHERHNLIAKMQVGQKFKANWLHYEELQNENKLCTVI